MPRLKVVSRRSANERHGYDGTRQMGHRVVEDPFDPDNTISVPVNLRHDPLLRMFQRGEIDTAQLKAGEVLRGAYEVVLSSGLRANDLGRVVVDGGRRAEGKSEITMRAAGKLRQAQALLGWQVYRLVTGMVLDRLNGSLIAEQSTSKIDRKVVQWQLRNGLEQLAVLWGLVADPARTRTHASMVSMITEKPEWGHEEQEIIIRYG
ncbi:MAG: hypothetical protein RL268_1886 [Pseudomonadota bacterium]|jgi:hypothetical protein